uniref:Anoctamin transmembrane domain-containing protein n=1 Tax=Craspedostauros australis TaxID=1486917 RepID=A0A7R9ZRJ6_9STRA
MTRDMMLDGTIWLLMGALPVALGLCIPILNLILMNVSVMLNNFENYRTESEYRAALIIKVFTFRFVSQFGTVYYYAYLSIGSDESIRNGIVRMGTSLLIYTTVSHWFQILLQVYFFMLVRQIRRFLYNRMLRRALRQIECAEDASEDLETEEAKKRREIELINKRILLDQAQDDIWFEVMNPPHTSFPEYMTAVVQFSFVACFSVVMPLIPFFCLVNCLLSMRFDAYKICKVRRRPLAQQTGGMGVWEHLLHIVAVIAILTNCWLMGFTNSNFAWLAKQIGPAGLFGVVVAWEHVMLLIKYVMQTTISAFPKSVRDDMRREQHRAERERNYTLMARNRKRRPKIRKTGSQLWLPGGSGTFEEGSYGQNSHGNGHSDGRVYANGSGSGNMHVNARGNIHVTNADRIYDHDRTLNRNIQGQGHSTSAAVAAPAAPVVVEESGSNNRNSHSVHRSGLNNQGGAFPRSEGLLQTIHSSEEDASGLYHA